MFLFFCFNLGSETKIDGVLQHNSRVMRIWDRDIDGARHRILPLRLPPAQRRQGSLAFDSILLLLLLNTHLLNCIVGSSNPIDSRPRSQIHAPYASRDPPLGQEPRLRPCTSFNHFDSFFDSLND